MYSPFPTPYSLILCILTLLGMIIIGILTATKNITDRKQLEQTLEQEQKNLKDILNNAIAAISSLRVFADGHWEVNYLSTGCQRISGYSSEELMADQNFWVSCILPEDWQALYPLIYNDIFAERSGTYEYRFSHKDGRVRWFSQTNSSRYDETQNCWIVTAVTLDISDRKRIEETLREKELQFQQLAEASPGIIYTVVESPDGPACYEYISPAFEEIHELPIAEVLKDASVTLRQVHPEDLEGYRNAVLESLAEMKLFRHEWRIITPSGRIKWIQANSRPQQRDTGEIVWHGTVLDVTERKEAEEQLRKTEQWLKRYSEHSPSKIYTLVQNPDGFLWFEYVSDACETIMEIPPEKALENANLLLDLIHPEDRPGYQEAVTRSRSTMTLFDYEWRIITPSGQIKWLQGKSQPQRRGLGFMAWYGVVLDVTARKETERQLQQALKDIDTHFYNSPLAIIQWDQDFRILRWSQQAELIFGWTIEEVQGFHWQDWQFVYEEDRDRIKDLLEPLVKGEITNLMVQNRNYTKHGRVITCQWYVSAIFEATGNLVSILSFAQDITQHQQAQLDLRRQKELRETIFNEATDAIFLVEPYTRIVRDCNRRAVEMFEMTSKDDLIGIQGHTLQRYHFTPQELDDITAQMDQQGFWSREIEYKTRTGKFFWGHLVAKPVLIADSRMTLVQITDITERKRQEKILQDSETRLRLALEVSKAIAWERDLQTDEIYFSSTLDGTESLILSYRDALALVHPDDQEKLHLANEQAIQGRGYFYIEHRIQDPNYPGSWRWLQVSTGVITDAENNPIRLVGMSIDITAIKAAEEALRESEERFRGAFEGAGVGIALVSLEGYFLKVNHSFCEFVGYSERELMGRHFQYITHPDDIQANLEGIRQILTDQIRIYHTEKRYIHSSGLMVWGLVSVSVIRDRENYPLYFVAQIQDISERKKLERMKNDFISIVSHELRTPLTAIRGSLGLLDTGVLQDEPETAQRMLKVALNNSERLVRLVNDILDLERLDSGKTQFIKQICSVSDLIEQAIESVTAIALVAKITIHYDPCSLQVSVAPDAIVQTLTNLLSNALKFSPEGSHIYLKVEWFDDPLQPETGATPYLLFSVRDQGRGIPSEKLETIFGRFQQVDVSDSRAFGGTGLGLAICKSLIEQQGGRIWVESMLSKGSTFYFTIPLDTSP